MQHLIGRRDLLEPYTDKIGEDYLIWVFYFGRCRPSSLLALGGGWVQPISVSAWGSGPRRNSKCDFTAHHGSGFLRSSSTAAAFGFSSLALSAQRSVWGIYQFYLFNTVKAKLDIFCLKNLVPRSGFPEPSSYISKGQEIRMQCVFLAKSVSITSSIQCLPICPLNPSSKFF